MRKGNFQKTATYIFLIICSFLVIFPIYWVVITSLKTKGDILKGPNYFPFIDFKPTISSWKGIITEQNALKYLLNSLVSASFSATVALILGSMSAYGLLRFKFKIGFLKNQDLNIFIISQRIMPPVITALALYLMFRWVNLLDNVIGLVLIYSSFNLPIAFWLMRNFISQIPLEIEEAAMIDGASHLQIFSRIVMPLAIPGIVTTFFMCWLFAWNEFLYALFLTLERAQTLPILLAAQHSMDELKWYDISTMSLWSIIPALIITVSLQKYFVRGFMGGFGK